MSKRPALPVPTSAPLRLGRVPGGEPALSDNVLDEVRRRLAGGSDPDPRLAVARERVAAGESVHTVGRNPGLGPDTLRRWLATPSDAPARESVRKIAAELGVHHETLRHRLKTPYSTKTHDEAFRGSPRASPLNNDHIRQLILAMKRAGQTDNAIAAALRARMPGITITTNMVSSQLHTLRKRCTEGA
jgi:lambda repressor-like predicted transcriptional regulator